MRQQSMLAYRVAGMRALLQDHQYLGITGFLFLRFLVPAIMNPKLFYLQDSHPSKKNNRTLMLLAKTLNSIGKLLACC